MSEEPLAWTILLLWIAAWLVSVRHQNQQLESILKQMANINEDLATINTNLTEAATEILALIGQLQSEQLTDEGRAALEEVKVKATALKDIVPNQEG